MVEQFDTAVKFLGGPSGKIKMTLKIARKMLLVWFHGIYVLNTFPAIKI